MKRPFAAVGFTGFAALLVLFICESNQGACCALFAFVVIGVLSLLKKNLRQAMTVPVCLFTAALACLLFLNFNGQKQLVQSLTGDEVSVEAVVSEAPYMKKDTARHYCVMKLKKVNGQKVKGKLRLSFSVTGDGIEKKLLEIGNRVCFTGRVYVPGENEKSISRYFTGENIFLGAYGAKAISIAVPSFRGVSYYFHRIRSFVTDKLRYGFSDKIAGLLVGILTGDKSCLDGELYDAFRETGMAHLMAVSGLHLSVWVFSLGSFVPESRKAVNLKCVLLIIAVVFIMLLAGMSESVKRAGFMCLVYLSGKLSKHRSDSLNSLGFAVLVMMLCNPACVLSVSLQLSFLATLGILTLGKLYIKRSAEIFGGKKINTPFKKLVRACADIFFISISVFVFTFPVLIYSFGGISTVSAWVNVLITPVVTPMLLLSGAYVLLSGVPFAAYPVATAVKLLAEYVISVTKAFTEVKNAFLTFERENILLFIVASVLIVSLSFVILRKSFEGKTAVTFATIILCAALVFVHEGRGTVGVKFHLADYGNAFALAVEKDKRAVLLSDVDEYEKGLFASYLEEKGIELFAVVEGEERLLLQSTHDGKYVSGGKSLELFEGVRLKSAAEMKAVELFGKYLCIFSSEALQYDGSYDIIIEMLKDDVAVSVKGKSFSLIKEGTLTVLLTADGKMILRGGNSWLNLMKSS